MPIVEYTPQHFESLRTFVAKLGIKLSLAHQPFVDYYYASQDWCRLYMLLGDDGAVLATLGSDRMRFEQNGREIMIGAGSSFYSARAGIGAILFVHSLKTCPIGLVYGGSEDTHRIIRGRNWAYYDGIQEFILNKPYGPYPSESRWRVALKSILRHTRRAKLSAYSSRIPREVRKTIVVREEKEYSRDLLPRDSPFRFRFAPTLGYLNWRYKTGLSFVKYRIFQMFKDGHSAGYVVLNESRHELIIAHCDGIDPKTIAYGVLLSLLQAGREDREPRAALLSSSHPMMQQIFQHFGFRLERPHRPFAVGTLNGPSDIGPDTSNWLVNFDWGDNGLRPPFLDESPSVQDQSRSQ